MLYSQFINSQIQFNYKNQHQKSSWTKRHFKTNLRIARSDKARCTNAQSSSKNGVNVGLSSPWTTCSLLPTNPVRKSPTSLTSNKSSHTKATFERTKKWYQPDSKSGLMINNFISVEETAIKNGLGLSLFKGLWTTNTSAQVLTITSNSLKREDFCLRLILKMEEKSIKALPL